MTTSLHREADSDLTAAFRHYKQEAGTGVAGRFLKEFRRVTEVLERDPGLGTLTSEGRRSFPLVGFPYLLIYREVDTGLRILVVRHQSRDPEYGTDRS